MSDSYHSYSDYLRGYYSPGARYQNLSASYSSLDNDLYRYSYREKELLHKLDVKTEENYKLRQEIENEKKSKESLLLDLDHTENELSYVKKRSLEREQSLNSKIRMLEIEKSLLEERANFGLTRNEIFKGQSSDKKLDIVVKFLNNVQKLLIEPLDQQVLTTENLTENVLSEKLNSVATEIEKLTEPKNKFENKELINFKLKELKEDNDKLSKKIQDLYEVFPEEMKSDIDSPKNLKKNGKEDGEVRREKGRDQKENVGREKDPMKKSRKKEHVNVQRGESKEKQLFYPNKDKNQVRK